MPLPPITDLAAILHIGHLASTAGLSLSVDLQRQIRHIAYEFIRLKEEEFGPNSQEAGPREQLLAVQGLTGFFAEALDKDIDEADLLEKAGLAEVTLREIRTLRGTNHFFSETLDGFFRGLSMLGTDYDGFAPALIWELHKYRKKRDEEEDRFLQPFHAYRDDLLAIVDKVRGSHRFSLFEVEDRIKRGLLAKLQTREWKDMQEFYDLVGLRIIVGNQREVDAAVALVEGALLVHESSSILDPESPHYFRIDDVETLVSVADPVAHIDIKEGYNKRYYNNRGYRAKHMNVRRHCCDDGHHHPTAEIQVMSRGIRDWGAIQRILDYKSDDRIPEEVTTVIRAYCRSAADYIVSLEDGQDAGEMPDLHAGILILNHIKDEALRSDVLDHICDMDGLVSRYRPASR